MSDTTIDAIITKLRAGKDPDTGELHITEQEAKSALYDLILKEVVGEDLPMEQPFDDKYDDIERTAWQIFRKGANWSRAEQRNKLKGLFDET